MKNVFVSLFFAAFFISCSNPSKASKANFTKILNDFHSQQPPSISSMFMSFPIVFAEAERSFFAPSKETIEALLKAELIVQGDDTITEKKTKANKFECTTAGQKCFVKKNMTSLLGRNEYQGFSFAKETVTEIVSFSAPADLLGKKVSEVKYKTSLSNIAEWSKLPEIQKSFNNVKEYLSPDYSKEVKSAVMILTSNGWIHEQLYSD